MSAKSPRPTRRPSLIGAQRSAGQLKTKNDQLIALLRRRNGQDITQLTSALGWLPNTVRAAISGLRKKGFNVERQAGGNGRGIYRIRQGAGQ